MDRRHLLIGATIAVVLVVAALVLGPGGANGAAATTAHD